MASQIDNELELAANLAKRRMNVVNQIKTLHPEIADDVWMAVSSQTNLELGDRINQFKHVIETKKKALQLVETDLWNKLSTLEPPPSDLPLTFNEDSETKEHMDSQTIAMLLGSDK